jgi:protein TonB
VQSATVVCPNYQEALAVAYPREAQLDGIQGEVLTEFTVAANGQVKDFTIKSSSNRVFNRTVQNAVLTRLTCKGQGRDIRVQLPFSFKLN